MGDEVLQGASASVEALPSTRGMTATFDFELIERYGEVLAAEAKRSGEDVAAAPPMRLPGGFSEDPFLTGVMGKHLIMGIQAAGVRAATGLPAGDPRNLIPYEMAVKDGQVACVTAEHPLLDDWGFRGSVIPNAPVPRVEGHAEVARMLAGRTITLLKNDGALLPLSPDIAGRILVLGPPMFAEGVREVLAELGAENPVVTDPSAEADTVIAVGSDAVPGAIVVLTSADPADTPWLDDVPAVLECYHPGQQGGRALADVLFGTVTPSGKLPAAYPAFPFGFGLSFTTFDVHTPEVTQTGRFVVVNVPVTNTGSVAGGEVPQVYADIPVASSAGGAVERRLVGFRRVEPAPSETAVAVIEIDAAWPNHPFSRWDDEAREWVLAEGDIVLHIGTSAADLPYTATVRF